jgi:PAS domain S-box-containing protein
MRNGEHALTEREAEVIDLSSAGSTDKEIAARLGVSVATVVTYWFRIKSKLGVQSRSEAIVLRAKLGAGAVSAAEADVDRGESQERILGHAPYVQWVVDERGTVRSLGGNIWKYLPQGLGRPDNIETSRFLAAVCPPETVERLHYEDDADHMSRFEGKWFETHATVTRDEWGHVKSVQGISVDVTGHMRKIEDLELRCDFLQSMLDLTAAVVFVFDLQSKSVLFANNRLLQVLGYTYAELLNMQGSAINRIVQSEDRAEVTSVLAQLSHCRMGELIQHSFRVVTSDGLSVSIACRSTPFCLGEDGRVKQIVCTGTWLTDEETDRRIGVWSRPAIEVPAG